MSGSSFSTARSIALTGAASAIMVDPGFTLTATGPISGAGGLVASGSGTLALTNANNSFGGAGNTIALNAGTLSVGSDGAMGNAANSLTFNGGALNTTASFASGRALYLNAVFSYIAVNGSTTLTLNGLISGAGGLALTGPGRCHWGT